MSLQSVFESSFGLESLLFWYQSSVIIVMHYSHIIPSKPRSTITQVKLRNAARARLYRYTKAKSVRKGLQAEEWMRKEWESGNKNALANLLVDANFNKEPEIFDTLRIYFVCKPCLHANHIVVLFFALGTTLLSIALGTLCVRRSFWTSSKWLWHHVARLSWFWTKVGIPKLRWKMISAGGSSVLRACYFWVTKLLDIERCSMRTIAINFIFTCMF